MSVPLHVCDIYDLISDFDPETNNFVESIQNNHLKKMVL
jgi:hypothetical protein